MADKRIKVNVKQMYGFSVAMYQSPKLLAKRLADGFRDVGRYDIETLKARLPGKFNIRAKGLLNAFKAQAKKAGDVKSIDELSVNEYTGWKAATIFQTGGTATGHGKKMTVLQPGAFLASGRRKYTQKQLRDLIAEKKARWQPTPQGVFLVMDKGGLTKTGKYRKGTRSILLAKLVQSVHQRKRLDFYENADRNASVHEQLLGARIEDALIEIAKNKADKAGD